MNDASSRAVPRGAEGRFAPGNPGRPVGARNRMSRRIALGLLRHYALNEAEILARLTRGHFAEYMKLIGQMLPRGPDEDWPDLGALPPADAAAVTRAVRAALDRVEAGEASLAEVEAALVGMGAGEDPP